MPEYRGWHPGVASRIQSRRLVIWAFTCVVLALALTHSGGTAAVAGPISTTFTVRITGTVGLKFTAHVLTMTITGKSSSRSEEGTVPKEYTVKGRTVSVAAQKQAEAGHLKVEVLEATRNWHKFESRSGSRNSPLPMVLRRWRPIEVVSSIRNFWQAAQCLRVVLGPIFLKCAARTRSAKKTK